VLRTIKYNLSQGKTLLTFGFLQAAGQALWMATPLVIAGFFSEDQLGRYSLAWMVVYFFVSILIAAAQTPFIVHANQEREQTGRINRSFTVQILFLAASTGAFLLLMLVFNKAVIAYADITPMELVFACTAYLGLTAKTFLGNLFMALGQRIRSSVLEVVFGILVLGPIALLCLSRRITLGTAFAVHGIAGLATVACFLAFVDFKSILPMEFDRTHLRAMLSFTLWLSIGAAAAYFIYWGDNLVLRYCGVSMSGIGVYYFARLIFKGVVTVAMVLHSYFLPFVSQHIDNVEKMRSYLYSKRPKILALGIACITGLFVFAPAVLGLIYGDRFADAVILLRILLVACVLVLYVIFYEPILYARKAYRFTQVVNVVQLVVNFGLDVLLVPHHGLLGAAVATVVAYFARVVIIEAYFRTKVRPLLRS
jgi:O-antigen/teichoic acid export membrane protein